MSHNFQTFMYKMSAFKDFYSFQTFMYKICVGFLLKFPPIPFLFKRETFFANSSIG